MYPRMYASMYMYFVYLRQGTWKPTMLMVYLVSELVNDKQLGQLLYFRNLYLADKYSD